MSDTTHELTNRMIAEALGIKVAEYLYAGEPSLVTWRKISGVYVAFPIPDYLHDANAALALLPDAKWHLYYVPDKGHSAMWDGVPAYPWHYWPTFAEAICRSFMAWHKAAQQEDA
jgi:hypothetical protein